MDYTIKENDYIQLTKVYNTLLTIETKGENTIVMAECLKAMRDSMNRITPVKAAE